MAEGYERLVPRSFLERRGHSLAGIWLVGFLLVHLLTNSQAALYLGEDGVGFIREVDFIHSLPYLQWIELLLLALPFTIHIYLGVSYLREGKFNSFRSDGTVPFLPQLRNQTYSWQRITAWFLLFALLAHVLQMRFLNYPWKIEERGKNHFFVQVTTDPGLYSLAARLPVKVVDRQKWQDEILRLEDEKEKLITIRDPIVKGPEEEGKILTKNYRQREIEDSLRTLTAIDLTETAVLIQADSFGVVTLFALRDTFKNPLMIFFYCLFVLAASFHAFNGVWTAMISWGVTIGAGSQRWMGWLTTICMAVVSFLGLAAVVGSYWINLRS